MGPMKTSLIGNKYILTLIDYFSRGIQFSISSDKTTTLTKFNAFKNHIEDQPKRKIKALEKWRIIVCCYSNDHSKRSHAEYKREFVKVVNPGYM